MQGSLPLNGLKAFEAAARHLSFTRAADELHVTQAAVSHQVKTLEQRLGVKLFRRLPKSLRLTDEGQALLPELRDAFERIARALNRVTSAQGVKKWPSAGIDASRILMISPDYSDTIVRDG